MATEMLVWQKEDKRRRFLRALARMGTITQALKAARVSQKTLELWREEEPGFLDQERLARSQFADAIEYEIFRRAVLGVPKAVYFQGEVVGWSREFSDMLLIHLSKAVRPEKFRERMDVTLTPVVKVIAGIDPEDVA